MKIKYLTGIKDRIKVDKARSSKDQKGKGYIDLTIDLYDNKQITKK